MATTDANAFGYSEGADTYQAFRRRVFALPDTDSVVREDPPLPGLSPLPPEMELQSRWFAGEFGDHFRTTCGREVKIRQPGHWNHSSGPDFSDAAIECEGNVLSGPLELDPDARDWEAHGHGTNPAFDGVILHVFFSQPEGRFYTRTSQHQEVLQVYLSPEVLQASAAPRFATADAKIGRCATPLADLPLAEAEELLQAAAQLRLRDKARRHERVAQLHGESQALYQGLAEALGYRYNQLPMRVLAQRLSLRASRSQGEELTEALLFGHAGFLQAEGFDQYSPPTRGYLRTLWDGWWRYRQSGEQRMPLPDWRISGARPGNHPQRRLGALSAILHSWPEVEKAFHTGPKEFARVLGALEHPFWSERYTLRSEPTTRPVALIGASRVAEILANLTFPILVPKHHDLWADYLKLPARQSNEKLKRAVVRLFGERTDAPKLQRRIYQQQGLLQIYQDFCLEDDSGCDDCPFPEQLGSWGK